MQKKIVEKFQILFPHIFVTSIEQHEGAQNYVIEINNEWMCKVAKPNTPQELFATEITLLNFLKNKLSTQIPEIIFHDESILIYKKLNGKPLTTDSITIMSFEQKQNLAQDIAQFLHELHKQPVYNLDLPGSDWPYSPHKLQSFGELITPYPQLKEIFRLLYKNTCTLKKKFHTLRVYIMT
ncbi:hypothetical protein EBQ93_03825 [bacterium]|nr:hypothetical protein [bacterium]